jgi:hypothetical protein
MKRMPLHIWNFDDNEKKFQWWLASCFVWNTTLICQIEPIIVICANKSTQDLMLIKMWCAIKWLLLINQL